MSLLLDKELAELIDMEEPVIAQVYSGAEMVSEGILGKDKIVEFTFKHRPLGWAAHLDCVKVPKRGKQWRIDVFIQQCDILRIVWVTDAG